MGGLPLEIVCPVCSKRVKRSGIRQHLSDTHGMYHVQLDSLTIPNPRMLWFKEDRQGLGRKIYVSMSDGEMKIHR